MVSRLRLFVFFRVLSWVWNGWKMEVDIYQPDPEEEALRGLRITIGDYEPEVN